MEAVYQIYFSSMAFEIIWSEPQHTWSKLHVIVWAPGHWVVSQELGQKDGVGWGGNGDWGFATTTTARGFGPCPWRRTKSRVPPCRHASRLDFTVAKVAKTARTTQCVGPKNSSCRVDSWLVFGGHTLRPVDHGNCKRIEDCEPRSRLFFPQHWRLWYRSRASNPCGKAGYPLPTYLCRPWILFFQSSLTTLVVWINLQICE